VSFTREVIVAHGRTHIDLRQRLLCALVIVTTTACASAPARPAASTAAPSTTATTWVERSAEYAAAVLQTYRHATTLIESAALNHRSGTWAVVLDADETIVTNLAYQLERERAGLGYSPESWSAWVRRREAVPLPGAAGFLARVRTLGGRIAIVTNRLVSECADTEAVFRTHQLVFDAMLCRPDGTPSDKNPRFAQVAAGAWPGATGPLEVVAFVGDNIQDFPSLTQAIRGQGEAGYAAFGVRWFIVPNPMYGSWQP
jgi:5'-nucleotidase (lipoprotein e(P4) family)